ncbi:GNAT family N-acetyltransferase (plasmid) [Ensifer adhaerens]|nr:GNAT family N-acetyltransferase [Ensifer adhaerens]UAX97920.1 GNAT family N-acetyltransferase [Ensifer adhaerens]UAY05299.1 GNAT family N-acetyltransferase [Ensifer adhaerens]UAY12677.1 GNAT family N-acetyltransferase [Ensifer adhaerens]
MTLHHHWDPKRFLAAGTDTKAFYGRWLQRQLEKPDVMVLAAEQEEAIVGYAYASVDGYDYMALRGPAGVVHDLFAEPEHRNQGIGRMLLDAVIAELQRRGANLIVLSTARRNDHASKNCHRCAQGFSRKRAPTRRRKHGLISVSAKYLGPPNERLRSADISLASTRRRGLRGRAQRTNCRGAHSAPG